MDFELLFLLLALLLPVQSKLEYDKDKMNPSLDEMEPWKRLVSDFTDDQFQLVDPGDGVDVESMDSSKNQWTGKRQRNLDEPLLLELAVFIDKAVWTRFVSEYGREDAENRLRTFAEGTLNHTRYLFQQPGLSSRLNISMVHFEIWKDEPERLKKNFNKTTSEHLKEFCSFVRPKSRGFDHATLFTGPIDDLRGRTSFSSMCGSSSCSFVIDHLADYPSDLVNYPGDLAGYQGHGLVLAHELGHSLGMRHDGNIGCNSTCCIMSEFAYWRTTHWSKCSIESLSELPLWHCLNDQLSPENSKPSGQKFSDEAQCHQHLGSCYRNVPGHQGDCRHHYCSKDIDSNKKLTTLSKFKLDGTYCGFNQICDDGECIYTRSAQLHPVHGGWSAWSSEVEGDCGDGNCSNCQILQQSSLRTEFRRCDAPYPNNGGRPCLGTHIRGVLCQPSACLEGSSSKLEYMRSKCRDNPHKHMMTQEWFGCKFYCSGRLSSRDWFPDGTECNSHAFGGGGKCVQRVCMHPRCQNSNYYVSSDLDCLYCRDGTGSELV